MNGRYCSICGQENTEPKETFWHLVTHFVYDITHFDGKFFSTVKYLLLKPGFLSRQYMMGRRNSYLNPIKMYVFTSAFFFIFFFSFINTKNLLDKGSEASTAADIRQVLLNQQQRLQKQLKDSSTRLSASGIIKQQQLQKINEDLEQLQRDTTALHLLNYYRDRELLLSSKKKQFTSEAAYDSIQQTLPKEKRDNWVKRKFELKQLEVQQKYGANADGYLSVALDKFMHYFPQIMFVSLPIFALILQLLYFRRKQYYYADHGIFTVHLYCAMYIFIFIQLLLEKLDGVAYFGWVDYLATFFVFYMLWYIYRSMKVFYMQSTKKTFLKYLLLWIICSVVMGFLFLTYFVVSLFTV